MLRIQRIYSISLVLLALGAGCGSGVNGGPNLTVNLLNPLATTTAMFSRFGLTGPEASLDITPFAVGQATAAQLFSLKYYIKEIRICSGLEVTGTAYNNPTGCLTLYKNDADDYDSYGFDTATAETGTSKYIDLMSKADLLKLKAKPAAAQAGEYTWGLVDWYKPLKVKAEVTVGGDTYRTTAGTAKTDSSNSYTEVSSLTVGTVAEAVVQQNNGGNWFKFQNPLTLTGSEAITLDLVFNPENLIIGSPNASNYSIMNAAKTQGIYVPLLDLAPVAHTTSQRSIKESYLITLPSNAGQIRLELYSIEGDAAKTIYGVDIKSIKDSSTPDGLMHPNKVSFIGGTADSIEFQDYQKTAMISGFKRLTAVGAGAAPVTVNCTAALFHLATTMCSAAPTATSATYALTSIAVVE